MDNLLIIIYLLLLTIITIQCYHVKHLLRNNLKHTTLLIIDA